MGIAILGDCTWRQLTYPQWTVDGFGMDHATVRYNGWVLLKEQFESQIQKFQTMGGVGAVGSMMLENWSDAGGTANILNLDAHYIGFRNGQIPQVKYIDGTSYQSAQGSGTDTATGEKVSGTIFYYASRTTWTWFETSQPPSIPRYNTTHATVNPFSTIQSAAIQSDQGDAVFDVPYSSFVAVFNSLRARYTVSDYTSEILIPGKLWACQSIIDYKLQ